MFKLSPISSASKWRRPVRAKREKRNVNLYIRYEIWGHQDDSKLFLEPTLEGLLSEAETRRKSGRVCGGRTQQTRLMEHH
jgi:hypothetical protein